MSDSSTLLDYLVQSQSQKEVTANALFDSMSPNSLFGRRASSTSGLTWGFYGGVLSATPGARVYVANGTIALTASATNYVEADPTTGVVTKNTSAFTAGQLPLYKVVVGASTVSSYEDWRASGLISGNQFVSPTTTKGDLIVRGASADDRLPVGTDGYGLVADSTEPLGVKWVAGGGGGFLSPLTTKGDVHVFSTVDARLPVGSNGQALLADSTQTTGLRWGALDPATITLADAGNYYTTDNVEAALQQVGAALATGSSNLAAHLADTSDAHDASAISIVDAGTHYTGTDVEAALAEAGTSLGTLSSSIATVISDLATHLADATDAHDASAISVDGSGFVFLNPAIDDVQELAGYLEFYLGSFNTSILTLQSDLGTHTSAFAIGAHVSYNIDCADAALTFLPTTGNLKDMLEAIDLSLAGGPTGAALTRTNDTNVTLTLGGSPTTALVHAASLTLGWTGTLAVARGGTGAGTLTGYLKGNGTSAVTASAAVPATDVSIVDAGNYYTGSTVEAALQEAGAARTTYTPQEYVATAGQTTFTVSAGYTVGFLEVFQNGARLSPSDYTATNGTTFVLDNPAALNDTLLAVAFSNITLGTSQATVTSGTVVASTSGTTINFSGIPSWVKKIEISLAGVSTSGTSTFRLRLGTGGVLQTTGYDAACETTGAITNGLILASTVASGGTYSGVWTLNLVDASTNTWVGAGSINRTDTGAQFSGGGQVSLAGVLNIIGLTTTGGTDTFDAGKVNILYM